MLDLNNIYDRAKFGVMIQQGIDQWTVAEFDEGPRRHLGASQIGHACERYLWLMFRHAFRATFIPRMLRLFQRGHREEAWLWAMLRADGWIIHDVDPATGKQWRVEAIEGHFSGSLDAIGYPPPKYGVAMWLLIECKTNKSGNNANGIDPGKNWQELEKYKLEVGKPLHWAQANVYGYLKGLTHVLYINTNKDDDRMHIECAALQPAVAQKQLAKAEFVILSNSSPPKLHQNSAHRDCQWCDALAVCHKGAPLLPGCRSCRYSMPVQNKGWYCTGHQTLLMPELIRTGCMYWSELVH